MDISADVMQREGMQSTYGTFASTADVSSSTAGAQHAMPTQALMHAGLYAFQSLTPGSTVQPHSMSYVLPTSSQLLTDSASTLAGVSGGMSSTVNNSLHSGVTPGITGLMRPSATIPGAIVQPSATAYTHSSRVNEITVHFIFVILI